MPKRTKSIKSARPVKKLTPSCEHEYIRTDGVTICSKCNIKSISYLTPLPQV